MYKFWTVDVLRFVTIFFTISVFVSMFFYPGGNIHDPSQLGYSISHNFLSDLGGYKSHSGLPNLISFLIFNFSMTLFTLIGISFLFIPKLFRDDILSFTISIIGSAFLFFIGASTLESMAQNSALNARRAEDVDFYESSKSKALVFRGLSVTSLVLGGVGLTVGGKISFGPLQTIFSNVSKAQKERTNIESTKINLNDYAVETK